jgi:hypothetical protein
MSLCPADLMQTVFLPTSKSNDTSSEKFYKVLAAGSRREFRTRVRLDSVPPTQYSNHWTKLRLITGLH